MKKSFICAVLVLGCISLSGLASSYEYQLDDGAGYWAPGPSLWPADMLYGNYFEVEKGYETIDSISVAYSSNIPEGRDVVFYLFEDPDDDMDPTNAIPVASHHDVSRSVGMNEFLTFDIEDTQVSGGFFVGMQIYLYEHENSVRMDESTVLGQSWLFFSPELDPNHLGDCPLYYNMGATPFNGAWMIRAQAIPEPVYAVGVFAGLLLFRRR